MRDGARRGGRAPGRDVEDDDLGEGRAGRADRGDDVALAARRPGGHPSRRGSGGPSVRRSGSAAAGDRHAPQLHRAVDRCREQDVRSRPRRPRWPARSPIVTSLFIAASGLSSLPARRSVPPPAARVGAVRGEAPDPGPVAGPREAVAEGEDRGAVAGPGRGREGGVGAAGDRRHLARRHVHDVDPGPPVEIGVRPPVRGKGDPRAVRRPGGPGLRRRAAHQRPCRAGDRVHEPQVALPVVDEPRAVVLVAQAVDVAVVGQRRLAGLGLGRPSPAALVLRGRGAEGAGQDRELGAVRGPGEVRPRRAAGPSGGAPRRRRAAAGGPGRSPGGPSASFGRSGSSSTSTRRSEMKARVRPSGENRGWRSVRAPIVRRRAPRCRPSGRARSRDGSRPGRRSCA